MVVGLRKPTYYLWYSMVLNLDPPCLHPFGNTLLCTWRLSVDFFFQRHILSVPLPHATCRLPGTQGWCVRSLKGFLVGVLQKTWIFQEILGFSQIECSFKPHISTCMRAQAQAAWVCNTRCVLNCVGMVAGFALGRLRGDVTEVST